MRQAINQKDVWQREKPLPYVLFMGRDSPPSYRSEGRKMGYSKVVR